MKAQHFNSASLLGFALTLLSSNVFASTTTTIRSSSTSTSGCFEENIADGDCDLYNNTPECGGYDGGDCCACTCVSTNQFTCGDPFDGGFACIDPSAECVNDDDVTTNPDSETFPTTSSSACIADFISDGDCDYQNNTEDCDYDGGDCCECTCVDAEYTCGFSGHGGYTCLDPNASCVDDDDATTLPTTETFSDTFSYTPRTSTSSTSTPCIADFSADGDCDYANNNDECDYDGGDCCQCTCVSTSEFTCGDLDNGGFACIDPSASCVDDDDITALPEDDSYNPDDDFRFTDDDFEFSGSFSFSECIEDFISDGDCDSINNTEDCDYDGGDCCECTCVSTEAFTCGEEGLREFDCQDPSVNCDNDYVEAGTKTTITASTNAYDTRPGGNNGCMEDGCEAALVRDGDTTDAESRWSCSPSLFNNERQCRITFMFEEAQDIMDVEVAFWKADERSRTVEARINGDVVGEFNSDPASTFTALGIKGVGVRALSLISVGLDENEWLSLLEVNFMVEP